VATRRAGARLRPRRRDRLAAPLGRREAAGEEPDGRRFDVSLAAGDLAGEAQPRHGGEPQGRIEQPGRLQEGVAMDAAEACELGLLQSRNHPEHTHLLGVLHLGLEAHDVEQRAEPVVLAELNDGMRLPLRMARIGEPDRLHRPEAQGVAAARRHHLDRQAAVEIGGRRLEVAERHRLGGEQRIDERLVPGAIERAVEVVGAGAAGTRLVVARLRPGDRHVDGIAVDDRRDGIEEGEGVGPGEAAHRLGERRRGQRAGGDDDAVPLGGGQAGHLLARDGDQGMSGERRRDGRREGVTVDRQRAAGRHLVGIGGPHDQRSEAAHLGVQQADRIGGGIVGAERVGADELGQAVGPVGRGGVDGPHLVDHHGNTAGGDLPSGFAAGESAADDVNGLHGPDIGEGGAAWEAPSRPGVPTGRRRGRGDPQKKAPATGAGDFSFRNGYRRRRALRDEPRSQSTRAASQATRWMSARRMPISASSRSPSRLSSRRLV